MQNALRNWDNLHSSNQGNAVHAVRSFQCRQILGPYFWPLWTSFWFHTGFLFLASYAFGMWRI